MGRRVCCLAAVWVVATGGCAAQGRSGRTGDAGPRIVEFRDGIRIDYRTLQVEVPAKVILRDGPLELFAYSRAPVPKEHESILLLEAPPSAVYQALGLIGLRPGRTTRYFPETGRTRLASGDRVDVFVRLARNGAVTEESACEWMYDLERRAPMERTHWLFAGSERDEEGGLTADQEGTTVTVVDFPSAMLTLPSSHGSSDDELWLAARTEVIPPVGTAVTLILRAGREAAPEARAAP